MRELEGNPMKVKDPMKISIDPSDEGEVRAKQRSVVSTAGRAGEP